MYVILGALIRTLVRDLAPSLCVLCIGMALSCMCTLQSRAQLKELREASREASVQ